MGGGGITSIIVEVVYPPHKSFKLVRNDGTSRHPSFLKALNWAFVADADADAEVARRHRKQDTLGALRRGVRDQITAFRMDNGNVWSCERCKRAFVPNDAKRRCDVDHADPPFDALVGQFCEKERVDLCSIELSGYGVECSVRDRNFAQRWVDFHAQRASLQLLCAECNGRKSNRPRAAAGGCKRPRSPAFDQIAFDKTYAQFGHPNRHTIHEYRRALPGISDAAIYGKGSARRYDQTRKLAVCDT